MNEVSCRALDPFFSAVDKRSIPRVRLAEGVGYSFEHLQNRHERIDWDAFRRFMANVRKIFDEAALREIGSVGLKGAGFKSFALIGRTLFSASGFYRWMLTSGGMGNQMFSNMAPSFRELGPGRIDLDLQLAPGYEMCRDFFHFAAGGFQALPQLVGLEEASVRMVWIDRGARFEIEFEAKDSRRARLLKRLTRSKDARATAKELNDAIHVLERQRELLDLANKLGQTIWGQRDTLKAAETITTSLLGQVQVRGARLVVSRQDDVSVTSGQAAGAPTLSVALPGSPSWGQLDVWTSGDGTDAGRLLELIGPTIALAIENAVAYRELADYQAGLEQLVDARTAELREAQQAREMFFANVSHEIRTPLALILLAAADVQTRAATAIDQRSRDGLTSITDSARKLVRLVDELLLLAAGQADKLVLTPEPTDVGALLNQLVAAWLPAAEAAGLELRGNVSASAYLDVDPVAFERIVSNLVSNAVKYTPRGGRVDIELVIDGDVRLSVLDTGRGIDNDLATRLFGRFERAAGDDRRKAGTGIGLALVKQLVEAHGGSVSARPRSEGGSEFSVTLPRERVVSADRVRAPAALQVAAPVVSNARVKSGDVFVPEGVSQGTILVAEDEPRLAAALADLLREQYTVVVALDGLAALPLVEQHQPQLLITDVDMPGMNGIELSRRFRELTGDRLAPVLILSAVIDLRTRLAGLEAGAVDYVGKPFDPAELKARVASQFRMREMAMRLHRAEQLSAMGILTSGLAHELRNPANGIVNAIAPLRELLPPEVAGPDTDVGELIEAMKLSAEQIAFLVRQLLGFRNKADLELRPADMATLVNRALGLAKDALTGVEVRTQLAFDRRVMCAAPLLVQVLTNLVENAGHAAGRGGWIEIRGFCANGRVHMEVTDSGPGVPAELRERIFEPFFTTKAPGKGTGLGLSVARTIIHRHQGTLEVREREGKSTFVIELPAEPTAPIRASN